MQNLFAYNNEGDNPQGASKFDPTFPLLHFCLSRFAMGDNAILAKLWSECNTKRQERGEICSQQQAESKWTNPQERKEKIGLLPWEEVYAAVLNSDTVAPPDTRGGHTEILSHVHAETNLHARAMHNNNNNNTKWFYCWRNLLLAFMNNSLHVPSSVDLDCKGIHYLD